MDYQIPIAQTVENIVDWMTNSWAGFFNVIQSGGQRGMDGISNMLLAVPALLMIAGVTIFAFLASGKKYGFPLFTLGGLLLIWNQGLWADLMQTTTLVLISSLVALVIGIPLGIWMAKSDTVAKIVQPLLDFMQTMPGFVYLIPAVAFFGIGVVPGVFASFIFALPPTVRMTNLGIRQVPKEMTEAADSFGSTPQQKLFKVELPLAKSTILAGVNQTIMLALSMVVIASMVGAPGLGQGVLAAVQHADVGNGFVNGLALVILAIIIDRFTQKLNPEKSPTNEKPAAWRKWLGLGTALVLVAGGLTSVFSATEQNDKRVNLAYVQWDSEVASTNVLAEVLREQGIDVTMTPLDNAVMWQSVAQGQADASVSAWLPNTHKPQYAKYKSDLDVIGQSMEGAKVGLVVPTYMDVNSIADLNSQADKTITGIEPGGGIMTVAQSTIDTYPNLKGWNLQGSSTGAMTVALGKAIQNKEDIVITGWTPHWMFSKYDLKYLEDPEGTMGTTETISTIARKGLADDQPEAFEIMSKFKWTAKDMEAVMLDIQDGKSPEDAAKDWVKNNQDKVAEWIK